MANLQFAKWVGHRFRPSSGYTTEGTVCESRFRKANNRTNVMKNRTSLGSSWTSAMSAAIIALMASAGYASAQSCQRVIIESKSSWTNLSKCGFQEFEE